MDNRLPDKARVAGYVIAALCIVVATLLLLVPPATSAFPPQCGKAECLASVRTAPTEVIMVLVAFSGAVFLLSLNGLRLAGVKIAGVELPLLPPRPNPDDVDAIERDTARDGEADGTAIVDEPLAAAGALTVTVGSVAAYRLDDVPCRVVVDALTEIEKASPDRKRTMSSIQYFLQKSGQGQPWFMKVRDGDLWRISYAGRRKPGMEGTAAVTRVSR